MLREIKSVRQIEGEKTRRWFTDKEWDLYLWLNDDGSYYGFQLCYDKENGKEHAFTWIPDKGAYHSRVSAPQPQAGSLETPILLPDGIFDGKGISSRFAAVSGDIESGVRDFVLQGIRSYGKQKK